MKKNLVNALNNQIREELASAYIYFAIAADMEAKNWKGVAHWFMAQAQEEVGHAMKFYHFLNSRGEKAELEKIEKPKAEYDSILAAFEAALKHEKHITGCIHDLVRLARETDDLATESFLQWFVDEQVEEEAAPADIIDRLKLVGDKPQVLYMFDRELGSRE